MNRTDEEAATILAAYRSAHVIDPEYPRGTRYTNYCRIDGIRIAEVGNHGRGRKPGWRHDLSEVARLAAQAPTAGIR